MSRVYEALKKAERQHAEEQPRNGATPSGPNPLEPAEDTQADPGTNHNHDASESAETPSTQSVSAAVPQLPDPSRGPCLVLGAAEYSHATEQFHLLGLSLRTLAAEQGHRVFAITSALSCEGKSFVALNLAASLATVGTPVLLIDADLRAPSIHKALGLQRSEGLANYLIGDARFADCLHPTGIPNLILVPAGRTTATPTELLVGPRIKQFIDQTKSLEPEVLVIIDSPAAAVVPEPQILSRLADALLLVVAANRTPRELVRQTIAAAGSAVYGIVLNHFEAPRSVSSYYYGYDRYAQAHNH